MISVLARAFPRDLEHELVPVAIHGGGAQSLLVADRARPSSYLVQGAAVVAYALVLFAIASLAPKSSDVLQEEPLELVMLPSEPELPVVDEPPPVEPPIVEDEPPPPPIAEEPEPVAPVVPKPPVAEKKPVPIKKKVAEKPPVQQKVRTATVAAPGPARVGPPPPNAIPSGYANQIYARVSRAASTSNARAAIARGQSGRVRYRVIIGPNGQLLSKAISSSGNPTFDLAAAEALTRAAPFPPTGMARPISLSGAIVYR